MVRLQLVPRYEGRVTLRFPLREWPPHRRLALARLERYDPHWTQDSVWYPGQMVVTARDSVSLTAQVEGGTTRVAVAQSVASPGRLRNVQRSATGISFDAAPGEPVTFTKLVGVATSRDGSDPLPPAYLLATPIWAMYHVSRRFPISFQRVSAIGTNCFWPGESRGF